MSSTVETPTEIRPFHFEIPEEQMDDLRRRIAATRWPSKELVPAACPRPHQTLSKGETAMTRLIKTLLGVAAGTVLATSAFAQSARDFRGATPYVAIENEPAPKLILDPALPEGLPIGIFWAQYRVENVHIVPVFGPGALQTSPRVGHLHITVDDLPWWWADASDDNTIDIAGLPPGEHKVKVELVDANHVVFPGQVTTLTFTVPDYDRAAVYGPGH